MDAMLYFDEVINRQVVAVCSNGHILYALSFAEIENAKRHGFVLRAIMAKYICQINSFHVPYLVSSYYFFISD
jgi:hypothetical protein